MQLKLFDLNTSNVNVNLVNKMQKMANIENLNTSNVNVNQNNKT